MKKNLFFAAIVAMAFASCANDDVLVENTPEASQTPIAFVTSTQNATRASENNGTEAKQNLEAYHTTFKVWGYKDGVAAGNDVDVFTGDVVTHNTNPEGWTYTTMRYWDKSASGYQFYAAAPSTQSWVFTKESKKFSLKNYTLTGATIDASTSIDNHAVFGTDVDLMISNDITSYNNYTSSTAVNLEFNHILSRINIGVKKGADVTGTVKLNSIKVFNMTSNGDFNEGAALGDDVLANGTVKRWGTATAGAATFTSGVGYTNAEGLAITTSANYVYQALCIPQTVAVETVNLNGKATTTIITSEAYAELTEAEKANYTAGTGENDGKFVKVDVAAASTTSAPYIVIEYTLNDESFKYYYNLADVFNGTTSNAISFFEGWQNTLTITIDPAKIVFDAQVFDWNTKIGDAASTVE